MLSLIAVLYLFIAEATGMPDLTGASVLARSYDCDGRTDGEVLGCEILLVDGVQYLVYQDSTSSIVLVYQIREGKYERPLKPREHILRWARDKEDYQTAMNNDGKGDGP